MDLVPFSLVLENTRVCLTEFCLIESVAKLLGRFGYLLIDFLLDLSQVILDQHVGTVSFLRILVIDQRVVERVHMARSFPDRRMHEDRGVDTDNVLVQQRHAVPPIFLDVILQLNAILSVVVDGAQAIVNLGRGEYETILFTV